MGLGRAFGASKSQMNLSRVILLAAFLSSAAFSQSISEGNFGAAPKDSAGPILPKTPKRKAKAPVTAAPAAQPKTYPFHGVFEAGASDGTWFTLRGKTKPRRILVTAETRIWRGEATAELTQAISGERVTGSVFRNSDGLEQARSLRWGGSEAKGGDQVAGMKR